MVCLLLDIRRWGLVHGLIVKEEHIYIRGREGTLVALVFDSGTSGHPRRQVQQQECTVGTITLSTSKRISNFSKVLFRAAEASGTEWTVLNGTLMNVMELLIVTEKWTHYNHIRAMAFGISKVTELTVIACDHIVLCSLAGEVLLFSPTQALFWLGQWLSFYAFG